MSGKRSEHLIVQTAFLGDLLLGIPLFKQLRKLKAQDKLVLLCRKGLGDLILRAGLVDEIVEVDKKSDESWQLAKERLQNGREFGWVICPHESLRSALFVRGVRAEKKIGYKRWFAPLIFDETIRRPLDLPEALRQLALIMPIDFDQKLAGGRESETELTRVPEWADMTMPALQRVRAEYFQSRSVASMSSDRVRKIAQAFAGTKPIVFLAPGSVWATKMWTGEGYAALAREHLKRGARVVLIGAPDEKAICDAIVMEAPGAVSIAGETSLFESAEILAIGSLLVCNDSGAMHMAAAGGVPTVSIFGPTVLDFGYRPWQNNARVVQTQLACRPCGKHGAKKCPLGTHACMVGVKSDEVLRAEKELSAP